jgi:hypothetical protein
MQSPEYECFGLEPRMPDEILEASNVEGVLGRVGGGRKTDEDFDTSEMFVID